MKIKNDKTKTNGNNNNNNSTLIFIHLMHNIIQTDTRKITTLVINFDKIQGDTFIVLTAEWHLGHLHLTPAQF